MSSDPSDSRDKDIPVPLSRLEAMELAIRTAVFAHVALSVLSVLLMATLMQSQGVLLGLGVAAVLALSTPFVVLPIAAAIGFFSHLAFHGTAIAIPLLIRILVILFEATLFGWMMMVVVLLNG